MNKNANSKKSVKRNTRKTVFGIKLPPIETSESDNVKTVLDIDPNYYTLVEGRPIRPDTSINKYKQNIKHITLKKTIHGFLVDEILRIKREIETERNIYETAVKDFNEYQNSFDKFLAHDNNKTIAIMKKSDSLAKNLANQTEKYKKVNYELASLKSKLQYIDETLQILLSFENFLHKASPILWQNNRNIQLKTKHSEIFTMDPDIFKEIDVNLIKVRLSTLIPQQPYFKTPEQLLSVFSLLEKQNLNYLLVTEELNSNKNKFLKALDQLKDLIRQELDYIQQKINETEEIIEWNEIRENELQERFFKILEEKVRCLVSSETVLQIYNYVEYAYESLIAPNDTKLGSLDMTLALEREYDNLMLDLTALDLDVVKQIEKETYEIETKEIKEANQAKKLLKDINKLDKRLKSSYESPKRHL